MNQNIIALQRFLCNGPIVVAVQFLPGVAPVILCTQDYGIIDHTVFQEVHHNLAGAFGFHSLVIPDLQHLALDGALLLLGSFTEFGIENQVVQPLAGGRIAGGNTDQEGLHIIDVAVLGMSGRTDQIQTHLQPLRLVGEQHHAVFIGQTGIRRRDIIQLDISVQSLSQRQRIRIQIHRIVFKFLRQGQIAVPVHTGHQMDIHLCADQNGILILISDGHTGVIFQMNGLRSHGRICQHHQDHHETEYIGRNLFSCFHTEPPRIYLRLRGIRRPISNTSSIGAATKGATIAGSI